MFQASSSALPTSFSEFLCGTATTTAPSSDAIDWAPPARITSAALQLHSATRRLDTESNDETLRRSTAVVGNNNNGNNNAPPNSNSQQNGSRSETPTGTPRTALNGSGGGRLFPKSLHVMNGVVGLQSATEVALLREDHPTWAVTSAFHTAVGFAGFPMLYDTGLRGMVEVAHRPSSVRLSAQVQSMRPITSLSNVSWGIRIRQQQPHFLQNGSVSSSFTSEEETKTRTAAAAAPQVPPPPPPPPSSWDIAFRSEGTLYLFNMALTLWSEQWNKKTKRPSQQQIDDDQHSLRGRPFLSKIRAGLGFTLRTTSQGGELIV